MWVGRQVVHHFFLLGTHYANAKHKSIIVTINVIFSCISEKTFTIYDFVGKLFMSMKLQYFSIKENNN